jgi:hypothetical protein
MRTRGNTRDATQQPSGARGHHPVHQIREYKNMWEHTWRNTAALVGMGTPSRPSGQRIQEHVGTHVTQHSSPHGHGDTIPSIRSESTRTRGNTRDATQQPSRARDTIPSIWSESTRTRGNTRDANTAALIGTWTPSPPSGQRVQEHVGTHVTQHSSTHGHGDTIPSIRSESTRTRGTNVTRHGGANGT